MIFELLHKELPAYIIIWNQGYKSQNSNEKEHLHKNLLISMSQTAKVSKCLKNKLLLDKIQTFT